MSFLTAFDKDPSVSKESMITSSSSWKNLLRNAHSGIENVNFPNIVF